MFRCTIGATNPMPVDTPSKMIPDKAGEYQEYAASEVFGSVNAQAT